MKQTLLTAAVCVALAFPALAQEKGAPEAQVDSKTDRLVKESIPVCEGAKIRYEKLQRELPPGLSGVVARVHGEHGACEGQYLVVSSREGGFFLGLPWFLDEEKGTLEERVASFAWKNLREVITPVIEKTKTRDGLHRVSLIQTTERGKLPMEGEIDPAGTVLFLGRFLAPGETPKASRLKAFEPFLAESPSRGAEKPVVTVIEFSDFECPSCRRAAGYADAILQAHGDKVRYVRYDLPLFQGHPWALAASIAGRAVHRQKPELFWEFKKQVYANQEQLSAFTIGDFARGFAEDNGLDLARFDADVASEQLHEKLRKGAGVALSNDIRATPTYMVNGAIVDAGPNGKALEAYVASLLK